MILFDEDLPLVAGQVCETPSALAVRRRVPGDGFGNMNAATAVLDQSRIYNSKPSMVHYPR